MEPKPKLSWLMVHCHEMHSRHCRNAELRIKMCSYTKTIYSSNVVTSVIFSEAHCVVCFSFVLIVHLKNKSTNCRFASLVHLYRETYTLYIYIRSIVEYMLFLSPLYAIYMSMLLFVVYKVWTYSDIDSLGGLRRHGAHFVQGLVAEWEDMKRVSWNCTWDNHRSRGRNTCLAHYNSWSNPLLCLFVLCPVHIPNMTGLQVDRDGCISRHFCSTAMLFFPSVPTSWHILAPVKARKQIIVFFYFLNPIWTCWICSCL